MGVLSGSYAYASAFQSKPLRAQPSLDLYELFEIVNPDRGHVTCVGHAPSKRRRCQCAIAASNHDYVERSLDDISDKWAQGLPIFDDLVAVAGASLCRRFHQDQAYRVAKSWEGLMNKQSQTAPVSHAPTRLDILRGMLDLAKLGGDRNYIQSLRYIIQIEEEREMRERARAPRNTYNQEREARERMRKQQEEEARRRWRAARERQDKEREERQRQEKEEQERRDKAEREKREKEERERLEREKREKEEREKKEKEERTRAEEERKKREEKAKTQAKPLRPWKEAWKDYAEAFEKLQEGKSKSIPWPVRSGRLEDVTERSVDIFYREGPPDTSPAALFKVMTKENLKWHPDKISSLLSGHDLTAPEKTAVAIIGRTAIELRKEFQEKRSRRDSFNS